MFYFETRILTVKEKKSKKIILYFFIITCFVLLTEDVHSQERTYSSIEFSGSIGNPKLIEEIYNSRYKHGQLYSFSISTPYYIGYLSARIDFLEYDGRNSSKFESENLILGLRLKQNTPLSSFISAEPNIGIQKIQIGSNIASIERELLIGLKLETGIQSKFFDTYCFIEARRIYNYYRQNLLFIGAGVRSRIYLPKKVIRLIQ